jgi:methionyl-tRNA formyltransferase
VTYAHKLVKTEARLDFALPAAVLERRVRAFNPWPICDCEVAGERLRVHAAEVVDAPAGAAPGSVLAAGPQGLDIACGDRALRLTVVQREGGRPQPVAQWLNAFRGRLPE